LIPANSPDRILISPLNQQGDLNEGTKV